MRSDERADSDQAARCAIDVANRPGLQRLRLGLGGLRLRFGLGDDHRLARRRRRLAKLLRFGGTDGCVARARLILNDRDRRTGHPLDLRRLTDRRRRLRAREAEFFQGRADPFHTRVRYVREGRAWTRTLLWP